MGTLDHDGRYAIRRMRRTPGFTAAAIATLALGLGLNSAVSSVAFALFAKPAAFEDADRLVLVDQTLPGRPALGFPLSYPDYAYYRDHARRFADLAAHYPTSPMHVSAGESSFDVSGAVVTANYFGVLRLRPALGRFFDADEDRVPGRDAVAVISHDLWRTRFDGDARVLGADIRVNGATFKIVGVAPEGFYGVIRGIEPNAVFIPTAMFDVGYRYCADGFARTCRILNLVGRLQPDASIGDAQAEMTVLASQLEAAFPDTNRGRGVQVRAARGVRLQEQSRNAPLVAMLATAAGLVLLVASANVAGLLLTRALRRRREIAIRLALGASRGRLVRELLVESTLLAALGGAAGLIVAVWATEIMRQFFGVNSSGGVLNVDLSLNPRSVAVALAAAGVTGVLTGIAPALQTTRPDALPALKDETAGAGARRSVLRDGLIVCQVALSVLLLAGSALLVRSFIQVHRGPGFDPDTIVLMRMRPSLIGYSADRAWAFQRAALRRIEALPGVVSASPANVPPLPNWARPVQPIRVPGDAADDAHAFRASTTNVGPKYFNTFGSGVVVDGREFDDRDAAGAPRVAILNETVARRLFPAGRAVGSRLAVGAIDCEVVGVVKDLQFLNALAEPEPIVYLSFWQQDRTNNQTHDSMTHVRVAGSGAAVLSAMRKAIAALDPDVPVSEANVLGERLDYAFSQVRAARALLLIFGALALLLSAIGLYATLAFAVMQRSREIAIRVALGAARADVRRLVLRHGLVIVAIGGVAGVVAAVAAGPLLANLLYGVSPRDPLALIAGPAALVVVACLAIWLPVRRAMAVDPIVALRIE